MSKSSLRMPTRHSPAPCNLAAAVLLALAGTASAASPTLWQRVRADPRAAHVSTLTPQELRAFARDYGLERLLPNPNGNTIPVTNCNDDGPGSLRTAVAAAANGDTVDASGLACGSITLDTGAIDISVDDLTIEGPGSDKLTIDGNNYAQRVFKHDGDGTLQLTGMTVAKGGALPADEHFSRVEGGCIHSNGTVALGSVLSLNDRHQGVVVSHCKAVSTQAHVQASGGGILATRGLFMYASVISGCSAIAQGDAPNAYGGGAKFWSHLTAKYSEIRDNEITGGRFTGGAGIYGVASAVTISNSTIAGNNNHGGEWGGGAYLSIRGTDDGGSVEIRNSTISGNSGSHGSAALIDTWGSTNASPPQASSVHISSTTISGNRSDAGRPAVMITDGEVDLQSTIISGNDDNGQSSDLRLYSFSDSSHPITVTGADNMIGVVASDSEPPPPTGLITSAHPGLAPLAGNGGPTRTHALLPISPAIDHGNSAGRDYDQRGVGHPRVIGAAADIGAFERNPDVIFYSGFE